MSNDTEKHGLNTEPSRRPRGWNLAAYHWKPGFCPNPGGRGKGNVSLKTALLRKIRENPQKLDEVVSVLLDKASNGDVRAINLIGEMTSDERGAPVAAVQVNIGADGNGQFGAADEWSRQELDQILVGRIVDLAFSEPGRLRASMTAQERQTVVAALTESVIEPVPTEA